MNTAGALCSSPGWVTVVPIPAQRGSPTPVRILRPIAALDLYRVRMQRLTEAPALYRDRMQRPIGEPAAALFQMEKLVDPVCPAGVQALLRVMLRARETADRQPEAIRGQGLALPDFLQNRFCRLRASATRTSRI